MGGSAKCVDSHCESMCEHTNPFLRHETVNPYCWPHFALIIIFCLRYSVAVAVKHIRNQQKYSEVHLVPVTYDTHLLLPTSLGCHPLKAKIQFT